MVAALLSAAYCVSAQSQFVEVDDGIIDPRGAWSCVLYGNPAIGDERVLLNFAPDQSTLMARPDDSESRPWSPLSPWQIEDNLLTFRDSRTGRQFDANLELALSMTDVCDDLCRCNGVTVSRGGPCWPKR